MRSGAVTYNKQCKLVIRAGASPEALALELCVNADSSDETFLGILCLGSAHCDWVLSVTGSQ